jgi:hypothetical protein
MARNTFGTISSVDVSSYQSEPGFEINLAWLELREDPSDQAFSSNPHQLLDQSETRHK